MGNEPLSSSSSATTSSSSFFSPSCQLSAPYKCSMGHPLRYTLRGGGGLNGRGWTCQNWIGCGSSAFGSGTRSDDNEDAEVEEEGKAAVQTGGGSGCKRVNHGAHWRCEGPCGCRFCTRCTPWGALVALSAQQQQQ